MSRLRPYQREAVGRALEEWIDNTSTLICLPTGCGKTVVFADIIRRLQPKRACVLAHREELIWQARRKIEEFADLECEIEMADMVASNNLFNQTPVVIATVQTMISGNGKKRMERFDPMEFGLVVVDEVHHVVSDSYRRVLAHFKQNPDLKILGVTATPDRADEEALGQIIETVAFDYEILDAIHDGWLVPIEQQMVVVEGLDFSAIRTTCGDLNGADLAAVMEAEKNLQGMAAASLDIIGDRRTLVFTVTVKQAEMMAEIFNRHRPEMADWVCGKTPKEQRRQILKRFEEGKLQVVVNVGCLTEGFDSPGVEVIVQARPTKSRCLYAQQIGRATRPLPGIVDGLETADERKTAISESTKTSCLVIDFVGNSGRHKLMSVGDILGGNVSEDIMEEAIERARKAGRPMRMDEEFEIIRMEIEERKRMLAARKLQLKAIAQYQVKVVNPFDALDLRPARERGWDDGKQLSEKQRAILVKMGVDPDAIPYVQGKQLVTEQVRRWKEGLCTVKQANCLKRYGYETKDLKMTEASKLLDALARNNWRKPDSDQEAA